MDLSRVTRRSLAVLIVIPVALALACGGGNGGGTGPGNEAPSASITSPTEGATFQQGESIQFQGSGSDKEDGSLTGNSLQWESSVDGAIGTGETTTSCSLSAGSHTVRLIATDSDGASDTASVGISLESSQVEPAAISIVSGDSQTDGRTTRAFAEPLKVGVTDADGNSVCGATVDWSVVTGSATLSSGQTTTNTDGRTSVDATSDTLFESHGVRARLSGGQDSVTFNLETSVAWFRIGDSFFEDWHGRQNTNFDARIPVGTTVEWEYVSGSTEHTATSGEGENGDAGDGVPSGGAPFDSGVLQPGDSFTATLNTSGEWTFYCKVHPSTMFNSTLQVQ